VISAGAGAERLARAFAEAGRPCFVPYVMAGFPDPAASLAHARVLARHADVLELGVPFSDPLADGPTIQAAGRRALAAGTRPETALEIAAELEGGPPVVVMTYVNTVLAAGVRHFLERAARAGVAGLIVPDLPVDEAGEVREQAARAGIALVPLAAPTSSDARLGAIGRAAQGFVYCVAVTGVTGGHVAIDEDLRAFLARARAAIELPLVVGFGVRTPDEAAAIGALADGVVIASQIIRLIEGAPDQAAAEAAVDAFGRAVRRALAGVPAR
jgi:tryptophan synthase alpha chain